MLGIPIISWSERTRGKPFGDFPADHSDASIDKPPALLRKVLVVDDEQDLADMTATMLSLHGLDVLVAYSAKEALQALQDNHEIDAVFSDVVMPGMTGLQLAEVVRDMYPAVKIVLASGYTLPALLANREKPFLYTTKPYRIDTILQLLRT